MGIIQRLAERDMGLILT